MRQKLLLCLILISCYSFQSIAQRIVNGKITDDKNNPVGGVSITAKGSPSGTTTNAEGAFTLTVSSSTTKLVLSSVGYATMEVDITGKSTVDIVLTSADQVLSDVVVIGYGTARKKDLTGSVASLQAKDFNKGQVNNPDQLLQGKIPGLQIINSSGQPGAATIVKIRGNNSIRSGNSPLYVIDGIPLDGRAPRPGILNNSGVGTSPDVNPLLFINPTDIASMDILKDASASAIYGSRGANGVILVTLKKGQPGAVKIDVGLSAGIAGVMRRIDVLDASEYRTALTTYNAPKSDSGTSIKPFDEILHKSAPTQNYTISFSSGTENSRYRASFLYADQQGIIRKSGLKKYIASFNSQNKFLDKKLSIDFNVVAGNVAEKVAPVSTNAGSTGNIISLALIWNPTLVLKRSNGLYNQENRSGQVNPVALSEAYNDILAQTTLLANVTGAYKLTPELEYRLLFGVNYGQGIRKQELQGWIKATGGLADGNGVANVGNRQLLSRSLAHTLNYNKNITPNLSINALAGYEYGATTYQGGETFVYKFNLNLMQESILPDYHYYDNMQGGDRNNLQTFAFKDPSVELQSYFARVALNYREKYLLTATFRADGSSKFGKNNQYAYFPSVAAAWNIMSEDFMKNSNFFNALKLRVGYGQTGNQEFNPVDAALQTGTYNGYNNSSPNHFGNDELKWETVSSVNGGLDFTFLGNRFYGAVDYFYKKTKDPILDFFISQPTAGGGTVFKNLDGTQAQKGWVTNKGVEISLGTAIISKGNLVWNAAINATFVENLFESPDLANVPFVKFTGALHGQGSSGAYSQVIAHDHPLNVYYLPEFLGFDKTTGIAQYSTAPIFAGDPNPKAYMGFTTDFTFNKKLSLTINCHGAFGHKIFNNTAMSVLNINNIAGGRNIASYLIGNGESTANAITPSTRFLEEGNFFKLGNATISYNVGKLGEYIKAANIYVSGSNLFVISKYNGFDPEVNIDKALNGIPSLGVDYIGYPSSRTILLGINFSF